VFIVFCIPFVAIGLYSAIDSVLDARAAAATTSWTPVLATIQDCKVRVHTDSDGPDTYEVAVSYTYEYDAVGYTAHTFSKRRLEFGNKTRTDALCARLLSASTLRAHVDPEQPERATLVTGSSVADYVGVAFGLTFAGFGGMFVLMIMLIGGVPSAESLLEKHALADTNR
jgi:hypothetical protein